MMMEECLGTKMMMSTTTKIGLVIMVRISQKMQVWVRTNKGAEITILNIGLKINYLMTSIVLLILVNYNVYNLKC